MTISRREMLKFGAGATALWMAGGAMPHQAIAAVRGRRRARVTTESATVASPAKIPIGLELWSVRSECEKELPKVLAAVGKMGYQAVELAHSYYGYDAPAWRKMLDENGLKACGMHMKLDALEGDAFQKTVEIHKIIGTPYLIVAAVPKKNLASAQAIIETAKRFNAVAEQLKPHGMKVGYHCHGGDFAKIEGDKTPWELMGENTNPDVIMQLDIGNCVGGGGDPIAMLKKFPGRSLTVHLKHSGGKPETVIGDEGDEVKWSEVFQICETIGGTKQYVVEEEGRKGPDALQAVDRSLQNLRKMGK
jgi:sugar phosphate isomerase/epimerase